MSEAKHQRFEIDIAEIERELRRSAQATPAPRTDPLQELARIVGQDDPFRGIIGENHYEPGHGGGADGSVAYEPVLHASDRLGALRGPAQADGGFDPVADAYGSAEGALEDDDMAPLRPRRSRRKLAAVATMLLATSGAIAGGLYWFRPAGSLGVAGNPPVVTADRTPVKKAPENPGGLEVPNQDRQIYQRGSGDGTSRVVDGREQPIDVREAARGMPAVTDRAPSVQARMPVTGPAMPGTGLPAAGRAEDSAASTPPGNAAVATALGEPRRVRTVAVRPDGSIFAPGGGSVSDAAPSPAPVSTPTTSAPRAGAPASPAAEPTPPVSAAMPAADAAAGADPSPPLVPVKVLPPSRPKSLEDASAGDAPTRTASIEDAKPANYFIQVAVRPTEQEARSAFSELQGKFADIGGKQAKFSKRESNGKTSHRVRVGPMTKADASSLCTKLKASGERCFVVEPN